MKWLYKSMLSRALLFILFTQQQRSRTMIFSLARIIRYYSKKVSNIIQSKYLPSFFRVAKLKQKGFMQKFTPSLEPFPPIFCTLMAPLDEKRRYIPFFFFFHYFTYETRLQVAKSHRSGEYMYVRVNGTRHTRYMRERFGKNGRV